MADMAVSEKLLPPVFGKERRLPDVIKPVLQTRVLAFLFFNSTIALFITHSRARDVEEIKRK